MKQAIHYEACKMFMLLPACSAFLVRPGNQHTYFWYFKPHMCTGSDVDGSISFFFLSSSPLLQDVSSLKIGFLLDGVLVVEWIHINIPSCVQAILARHAIRKRCGQKGPSPCLS